MVDYTERLLAQWQPGQTRDLNRDMMRLTLGIVAKTPLTPISTRTLTASATR